MATWLDRLVVKLLHKKKTIVPFAQPASEPPLVVREFERVNQEGVYRFCFQYDFMREEQPSICLSTARYVALVDMAVASSLGIIVKRHLRHDYRRTHVSCLFANTPLSVLTPYDVYSAFWRDRQPIFTTLVSDPLVPILYREGGLELLAEPATEKLH